MLLSLASGIQISLKLHVMQEEIGNDNGWQNMFDGFCRRFSAIFCEKAKVTRDRKHKVVPASRGPIRLIPEVAPIQVRAEVSPYLMALSGKGH